ncbi:hypothetical protein BVC80_805g5 [Macleaya cordata]|uniref:Uncharacterized protein n=1 Tax=Macleaya cordata TaxID=56857 RepID=A0A200Q7U1_MACCD|nr:hypothetical protein BVC80_805g5 [Macleaya cordata]
MLHTLRLSLYHVSLGRSLLGSLGNSSGLLRTSNEMMGGITCNSFLSQVSYSARKKTFAIGCSLAEPINIRTQGREEDYLASAVHNGYPGS